MRLPRRLDIKLTTRRKSHDRLSRDPGRDWAHPCKDICNRWMIPWACACSKRMVQQQKWRVKDLILRMPKFGAQWQVNEFYFTIFRFSTQAFCKGKYTSFSYFFLRHFKGRRTFQAHIKNCPNSAGREVWCEFLRKVKWKHVFEKPSLFIHNPFALRNKNKSKVRVITGKIFYTLVYFCS